MRRFLYDLAVIIIASFITGYGSWYLTQPSAEPVAQARLPPTLAPLPTHVPEPTATPKPVSPSEPVIYVFNLAPMRVWFDKADAIGYREAQLNGEPTRPYISLEKSRTIRGGRMTVLKQEDGLVMVKVEGTDIVGWIQ